MQGWLAALDTLDGVPGNALLPAATLASVLVDDRLLVNASIPACDAYLAVELGVPQCGGRTLARDVMDDTLGAVVGPGVSDYVGNDSAFLADFPFLAPPNMAAATTVRANGATTVAKPTARAAKPGRNGRAARGF